MKFHWILFGLLGWLLIGCVNTDNQSQMKSTKKTSKSFLADEYGKQVYFLHHRLLPEAIFQSEGRFFADMVSGNRERFNDIVSEYVSQQYADNIVYSVVDDGRGLLLEFPTPTHMPNCYFALVLKRDDTFSYFTFERSFEVAENNGFFGVLGGWQGESHFNLGPRMYQDAFEFVKELTASTIDDEKTKYEVMAVTK